MEKPCPKCGEPNPVEAGMCWVCYAPLSQEGCDGAISPLPQPPSALFARISDAIFYVVPLLSLGAFVSSGWWPRRWRMGVMSVSVSILGVSLLREKWLEQKEDAALPDEEDATVRIANTLFFYAHRENATAIRIEERGTSLDVFYQVEGEWQEQMRLPDYVWPPLRAQLLTMARQSQTELFDPGWCEGERKSEGAVRFIAYIRANAQGETVLLRLK